MLQAPITKTIKAPGNCTPFRVSDVGLKAYGLWLRATSGVRV